MSDGFTPTHLMLDLETYGTGRDAAIKQIGAVLFRPTIGELGDRFKVTVDLQASGSPGMIDAATVEWWMGQSDAARQSLLRPSEPPKPLEQALHALLLFCPPAVVSAVWSNSPTFDETILRDAFDRHGLAFPINFRQSRCCRTIFALSRPLGFKRGKPELKHDALSDAVAQARDVCRCYELLGLRERDR